MKWIMIGPDGIPDRPEPYDTASEAARALAAFQQRFAHQGYYKRADGTKLRPNEIHTYCQIEPVADTPAEDPNKRGRALEIIQRAIAIVENSDDADAHGEWLETARNFISLKGDADPNAS